MRNCDQLMMVMVACVLVGCGSTKPLKGGKASTVAKPVRAKSPAISGVRRPAFRIETAHHRAATLGDVLQVMRLAGIRQVPVVDVKGTAVGVVAIDDAIELITGLLCDISGSIQSEPHHE